MRRRERMAPGRLSGDGSCFDRARAVGREKSRRNKRYLPPEPIYVTSSKVTYVLETVERKGEIVGRLLDENERGEREEALVLRFFPSRFSFSPPLPSLFFFSFSLCPFLFHLEQPLV